MNLNKRSTQILATLGVLLVLAGGIAPAAMASHGAEINPEAEPAQNPFVSIDVTKAEHDMGAFGDGNTGLLTYYDNNGEATTLAASVNESPANPVTYDPTEIAVSDYAAFPHATDKSVMNASLWTTSGANASKLSVSETNPVGDVDGLNVGTDGSMASGDTATATFDDFSLNTDESKRIFAIGVQIDTLDTGTTVEYRLVDEDGDYKTLTVDSSANVSNDDVLAASTGSHIAQAKLGDLPTEGSGDGVFNNVQRLEVVVTGGDYAADSTLLNADKLSEYTFGTQKVDTDGDGEKDETETITQVHGPVSVTGLDTLGDTFDNSTLYGVSFNAHFEAAELESENTAHNVTDAAQYQNYDYRIDTYYRFHIPSAYDLSYADGELRDTVAVPSMRYLSVGYAEGTGDTAMENVSSFTTVTSQYDSVGDEVTLDTTLQPGQNIVYHSEAIYTQAEKTDMFAASAGPQPMEDENSGGPLSMILSPFGGIVTAILAFLGIKKRGA